MDISSTSLRPRARSTISWSPYRNSAPWPGPSDCQQRCARSRILPGDARSREAIMRTLAMLALCTAGILVAQTAWAQRAQQHGGARGGFLVQTDLEFGGDTVATVAFQNGDTQNVHAGQGISLGIGGYV